MSLANKLGEIFYRAIVHSLTHDIASKRLNKPGAYYNQLSEKDKEICKQATAQDHMNQIPFEKYYENRNTV